MRIPLDSFEQYIDEKILQRGLAYWKKGHVGPAELIEPGVWEYIVQGTEDYLVRLRIGNNTVEDFTCSCPYDLGAVCKHVTAVLFELQKDVLFLEDQPQVRGKKAKTSAVASTAPKEPKKKPAPKRKTIAQQIDELLGQTEDGQLQSFVRELAIKDRTFRSLFLQRFAHLSQDQSRQFYEQQIRTIVQSSAGSYGYIEYRDANRLAKSVDAFMANARKLVESGELQSAVSIATAVAEEMCAALQKADDSGGAVGGCVADAIYLLETMAETSSHAAVHDEIFDWLVDAFRRKVFREWDWHFDILRLAVDMADSREQTDRLVKALGEQSFTGFWEEEAASIRYELIKKTDGEKAALRYLESNLQAPKIRRLYLNYMLEAKNFSEVISVAREGISQATRQKLPGLVNEWYTWLLKTAQAQKDIPRAIEYTTYLFLNSNDSMQYFVLLKAMVTPAKWKSTVDMLLDELQGQNFWRTHKIIQEVLVREQRWETLFRHLQAHPSLQTLEEVAPYLVEHYPDKFTAIYEKAVRDFLSTGGMGRGHYVQACQYLRSFKKIAGMERTAAIVADLKQEYAKRPALLEELDKV